jgi:hypothetical protein
MKTFFLSIIHLRKIIHVLAGIVLLSGMQTFATEIFVNSVSSFNAAQGIIGTGDTIAWINGNYANIDITVSKSGICVKSESSGGVVFSGSSKCMLSGDAVSFGGFQYIGGDIGTGEIIVIKGNGIRLSEINFSNYFAKKYVHIEAETQYNEIIHCNFENKPAAAAIGCTIQISTSPTVPGYHKIRYCSFSNYQGTGGDYGNEPIRIGLGAEAANISRTVIEYCYFCNTWRGDSETISVKCCENIIRYCTQEANPGGMFVFRIGDRNVAYGNFFITGSGGIRIKEANFIYCYNNYFESAGITGQSNAITLDYVSPNCKYIFFLYNTFVDCGNIDLGGTGPSNIHFANNVFKKNSGAILTNPNGQTRWLGNIYWGTLGVPIDSGMWHIDPQLQFTIEGFFGLSASSPAINASDTALPAFLDIADIDDDPFILKDISGQSRPAIRSLKDVGCDEYTTGPMINRILKPQDTGPSYLHISAISGGLPHPTAFLLEQNYPNPFNPTTVINYQLPQAGFVTLKVYDAIGSEVATLVNNIQDAGIYNVTFNASKLNSGVYFYTLKAGEFVATKKLLLLK